MASVQNWVPRQRDYEKERKKLKCRLMPTIEHPLRGTIVTNLTSKGTKENKKQKTSKKEESKDPLSMMASQTFEGIDPLSMMLQEQTLEDKKTKEPEKEKNEKTEEFGDAKGYLDETFEPWSSKRIGILSKYTTSEKLSITSSFLSGASKEKITTKQSTTTTTTDKMKTRLEQLDDFEDGSMKEMLNLSQQDYVNKIEQLNQELLKAWNSDQRVKALKISIQCSKLLGDISVMQFYPSKFVLITDILDNFGNLVFERIRNKSTVIMSGVDKPIPLPKNFTPDQVPESAKETCRNWFYKVASIRELIPRLYVEMAILKCYSFLTTGEYSKALLRLTNQIRGIGDPLVASYARTYLCRVGIQVAPTVKDHLNPCLFDFLSAYSQLMTDNVQNSLAKQALDMSAYLQLYCPSLEWILQCIAYKVSEYVLTEVMQQCQSCNSALILNSVLSAFDPSFIASRALELSSLIKECEDLGFPKYHLYKSLGCCVVQADPPEDQRLQLLNEVWRVVAKLKEPAQYIMCADVWIEFPLKHFTAREVNTLVSNIIKHMTPDRAFEDSYPQLLAILSKIVSHLQDLNALFSMEKLMPFLDMFQKESIKVEACKTIMEAFNRYQKDEITDPVIINALMQICKTMHDSVNSLSLGDDRRVIGNLICGFLQSVQFGRDFEQQLNFFVEARASFSNLDNVQITLVQSVNALAMKTREIVKGNHSRKTGAFVRACMAFCFITIPSMMDVFMRLKLYLLSGQVALANQAIGQADAFFRTAVSLIAEVPKTIEVEHKQKLSEPYLCEYIKNLLSTSLVIPDHPEHGTLYILRGLLNIIEDYTWEEQSDCKAKLYLSAINILCASCQETFVYNFYKVDSNDKLYGSDKKFIVEVVKVLDTLTNEILTELKGLGEKNMKMQAIFLLAFLNRLTISGDISEPSMMKLAHNIWRKVQSNTKADLKLMARTLDYVKNQAKTSKSYQQLADAMSNKAS